LSSQEPLLQVQLIDAGDLKAVAKALRKHADGKELRRGLSRGLREVAKPLVPKVRAAWLSAPSMQGPGRGQPDLRVMLAKATRTEVRLTGRQAGVRVRTDGRKMPAGFKSLPRYVEGTKRPWRHPVFGDRETWVVQRPFPRFYQAVQPNEAAAREQVEQVVADILRKIARAP
jgi:hypothetical protein